MRVTTHWLFWAILSAVFAAATAILSKVGLRGVDADAAQFIRTAVVFVVVGVAAACSGAWRRTAEFTSSAWMYLALAGFATAASWLCYYRALAVGDASRVAAVDKLSVPMVAVVAAVLLSERLGAVGWL